MGKKIKKTNTNKRWVLMNSMFDELGLVRQHLDSFNDFIEKGLQSVISEIKAIEPEDSEFYVKLEKIEVEEPTVREADGSQSPIYPMEARIRNLTYASRLFLHMKPIPKDPLTGLETPRVSTSVFIGYLPIMLERDDMIAMVISPTPKLRSRVMSILMRESSEIVSTEESLDYIGKRVAVVKEL